MSELLEQIESDLWTDKELAALMREIGSELNRRRKSREGERDVPLTEVEAGYILAALNEYKQNRTFGPDKEWQIPALIHKIWYYAMPGMGG